MIKSFVFLTTTLLTLISAEVIHLNSKNFDNVVDGTRNVLVKFEASWCGPCKAMIPILNEVSKTYGDLEGETIIAAIDADEEFDIGDRFDIQAFPTIKLFLRGKGQDSSIDYQGPRSAEAFKNFINQLIAQNEASLSEEVKNRPRSSLLAILNQTKSRQHLSDNQNPFLKAQRKNPNGAPHKERARKHDPAAPKLPKAPKKPRETIQQHQNLQVAKPVAEIREVSDVEARSIIANAGSKVVMLVVYSHDCPHCREFLPIALEYSSKRNDVIFIKLDGQKYYQYRDSFNLQFYPSIIGFKANSNGQHWQLLRGGRTIDNLNDFLSKLQ